MTNFITPGSAQELVAALGTLSGVVIDGTSVEYTGDLFAAALVSDVDPVFGFSNGILLTSGIGIIPTTNTLTDFGANIFQGADADLEAVVSAVFLGDTDTNDAAVLEFSFNVIDPEIATISFDLLFGSDEFPEFSNDFVDIAAVFVNGVNYAYFGGDVSAPLSVLDDNFAYFNNNTDGALPIEYDGVSDPITIFAPVNPGVNTIKIAIADTGDSILDSGVFLTNFSSSTNNTGGVFFIPDLIENEDGNVIYDSTANGNVAELIRTGSGDDEIRSGGGADLVDTGTGDDEVELGDGNDFAIDAIGNTQIAGGQGSDIALTFSGTATFTENDADVEGDFYCGGSGADDYMGGGGDDILIGDFSSSLGYGAGDRLEGGMGNDLLEGGIGDDVFVFKTNDGLDVIGAIAVNWSDVFASVVTGADFQSGIDKIELNGFGYANGAAALAQISDVDGVATFDDQGTSITFAGLTTADLSADDFILV